MPNKDTFKNFRPYAILAISSTFILCFESWAFHAMTIMTSYISIDAVGAHVICANLAGTLFMFSIGMSQTAAVLVGNYIGENNPNKAKRYAKVTMIVSTILTTSIVVVVFLFKT